MSSSLLEREKRWLLEEKYQGVASRAYWRDVEELQRGVPLDYLIGARDFLGCHIKLSHRPLIPRNETEYWTSIVIDHHRDQTSLQALDLCAGSGCIGIALLSHLSSAHLEFIEKNPAFVEQIKENLAHNGIAHRRYRVYQSDLFEKAPPKTYNLILANPPYLDPQRKAEVQDSVYHHEDHESLFAQEQGLGLLKKIIKEVPQRLVPGGSCYLEYDSWQSEHLLSFLQNYPLEPEIIPDQNGQDRVLKLTLSGEENSL